jgi:nanoRNase/pAp phosphatase (c-di-AMP/oligoRNAs hydrolase)
MVARLMVGCGTVGHALAEDLADREGELHVLDGDAGRVETLRNEAISAETGDVTDRDAVAAAGPADLVLVAGDDSAENLAATRAVRDAYPAAKVVAYVGADWDRDVRETLATLADTVVDPGTALLDRIAESFVDDADVRARRLRAVLADIEGTLGVFTHDNPDPDALASAVALVAVAAAVGVDAEVCYYGEISHQENRAFVNLLDIDVRALADDELPDYGGIALVDHSRPGVNDQLHPDTPVDVVVDHHPTEAPVEARFVDLREEAGATSTLLTDYVRQFGVDPQGTVATGLLYGIRVDTRDFRREVTVADFEAAAYLLPHADTDTLERIETPSIGGETLDAIAAAIEERRVEGAALASSVGPVGDRDALAQAADRLLGMEGITVTMVCGYTDGTIYVSARARGTDVDLGAVLRRAFDEEGSAGGHTDMAGAQIPLGVFEQLADDDDLAAIVADRVTGRFFEALREQREHGGHPDRPAESGPP